MEKKESDLQRSEPSSPPHTSSSHHPSIDPLPVLLLQVVRLLHTAQHIVGRVLQADHLSRQSTTTISSC